MNDHWCGRYRSSGIVVPAEKPKRIPSAIELQDDADRAAAGEALIKLWDACGLSGWSNLATPESLRREAHRAAWHNIADMLLGDEAPEGEMNT